jgi:hypothetical protein
MHGSGIAAPPGTMHPFRGIKQTKHKTNTTSFLG